MTDSKNPVNETDTADTGDTELTHAAPPASVQRVGDNSRPKQDGSMGGQGTSVSRETSGDYPAVALEVFGDRVDLARAYHESLSTAGTERGLIGPREVPRLWERHILNCAVIGEAIGRGLRVLDIGSGAGLPGIPLAIARPDLDITLIEPLLRRTNYLNEVVRDLGLDNVSVVRGRAEEKQIIKQCGKADIVTSRAVAPLGKLMKWSLPLCIQHGYVLAMKGSSAQEEIDRDHKIITAAKGGPCEIITVGSQILAEPTTLVRCQKR